MLGKKKVRQENLYSPRRRSTRVSRELELVRRIVDFGWFRDACRDKFCSDNGRPSIVPEVLAAMMFLGYWYNIRSDRELCEECEDRLSFREFIGIDDDDPVPVHSTLTHWRQRLGREVFQGFLFHTIELAKSNDLVPGRCRVFDSTLVKAQADESGPSTVKLDVMRDTNDYLDALGEWESADVGTPPSGGEKKARNRRLERGRPLRMNSNDLDARFIAMPGKKADFYQKAHFEFDLSSKLVMNADAGHVQDAVKMREFLSREMEPCDTVGGDSGYFTMESQMWLRESGIESFISVRDNALRRGVGFGLDAFVRLEGEDCYICPEGVRLTRQNCASTGERRYASPRNSCYGCQYGMFCFQGGEARSRRQIGIPAGRGLLEEAKKKNQLHRYKRIKIGRSITCEGGIGTMKNYGGLGRARGLGEESMAIQAALAGGVYNVKKILRHLESEANQALNGISELFRTVFCAPGCRILLAPLRAPDNGRLAA